MLNVRQIISSKLFYSTSAKPIKILEQLKNRSLIKITGEEASDYLQGLITNDINHLKNGPGSMYAMFLNTKGRVLYDTIIYRTNQTNSFLIECDNAITEQILKHLKVYRVRRKISIEALENLELFALFNPKANLNESNIKTNLDGFIVPCDKLEEITTDTTTKSSKEYKDLIIFKDPRISSLGSRIICKSGIDVQQQVGEICALEQLEENNSNKYRWLRYALGVGEGINDLPLGNALPLECNCDYLHGISFHKGCYIGQELTARTHHTGVVRKRFMPLLFTKLPTTWPVDNIILHNNVNLGKLRGAEGNVGLGLIRIAQALEFGEITVGNGVAKVVRPSWWPVEAAKEQVHSQKF